MSSLSSSSSLLLPPNRRLLRGTRTLMNACDPYSLRRPRRDVLSVQCLNVRSADADWRRGVVDVEVEKKCPRVLLAISHAKRNSMNSGDRHSTLALYLLSVDTAAQSPSNHRADGAQQQGRAPDRELRAESARWGMSRTSLPPSRIDRRAEYSN